MSNEKVPKPRLLRRRKELNEIEQIQARAPPLPSPAPPPFLSPSCNRSASCSKPLRPAATP
jgi:hypothetical protein